MLSEPPTVIYWLKKRPKVPMHLIATCPEEIKDILVSELKALGASNIEPAYRAVHFTATERQFYEAHLQLRTASRILKVVKDIPAKTSEMLYDQASRIDWSALFDVKHGYLIEGVPAERGLGVPRANDISKKVREGLQESFRRSTGQLPKVDLEDPKVIIVAYLSKGRCLLSLDTTGKVLHKRGYRLDGHPAPLKETLAASLLMMAGYDGSQALLDPMCGSGTLIIEGATIALQKPPQIHRKKGQFNFEWLKDFNKDLWREIQESLRQDKREAPLAPLLASDISAPYVEMAKSHALRARVEKHITFTCAAFKDYEPPQLPAEMEKIIISNLPYGERLEAGVGNMQDFYKEIGDTLKRKYAGWRAALLVSQNSPHKFIGLKPTRKIPIMNGSIECRLLIFDLYQGSRRVSKQGEDAVLSAKCMKL
jgi:putative N6-adenine-specific DNA methylase